MYTGWGEWGVVVHCQSHLCEALPYVIGNTLYIRGHIKSMVCCQKGPICHASAWRVGPFWQDTLEMRITSQYRVSSVYQFFEDIMEVWGLRPMGSPAAQDMSRLHSQTIVVTDLWWSMCHPTKIYKLLKLTAFEIIKFKYIYMIDY